MEVIPRFLAMTPVRIEFGVHFAPGVGALGAIFAVDELATGVALFAADLCKALSWKGALALCRTHSLSIGL